MQLNLSFPPSFPSNVANQRQEFIHESTPAETQAVLIRNCTNLKKHRSKRRGKKTPLHFWSEVFEVINTIWQRPKKSRSNCMKCRTRASIMGKTAIFSDLSVIAIFRMVRLRAKLWFPGFVRKCPQCPFLIHELFSIVSAIRKSGSRIRKNPHDIGNHAGIWVDIIVW